MRPAAPSSRKYVAATSSNNGSPSPKPSPFLEFSSNHRTAMIVWGLIFVASWFLELTPISFLGLVVHIIYANLDHKGREAGSHSAYSVFNKDQKALSGTMRANEVDSMLRGQFTASNNTFFDENLLQIDKNSRARYEGPPVPRNNDCPCGSGQKYKKCCGSGVYKNLLSPDDLKSLNPDE